MATKKTTTKKTEKEERLLTLNENFDIEDFEGSVELYIPETMTRDLKKELKSVTNLSRQEMKSLVDNFYQVQEKRIALEGQIRALRQGSDDLSTVATADILEWQLKCQKIQEKGLQDALSCMVMTSEVGRWLVQIKGIGPIIAACLIAYFDVEGVNYATHFISYAGLNDNNRPWLGAEASRQIVEEVLQGAKVITDEHLEELSLRTKWGFDYLVENCTKFDEDGNPKSRSKTDLIKAISKIPYNKKLKTLMFKIEESFVKNSGRGSKYGELYVQRKLKETELNEKGHYADQASRILATKNIGKSTDAYKAYSKGKLPKAHINRRAARWACKIFISHVFEEMYRVEHKCKPEPFYVFTYLGHKDYIEPEVEFYKVD